MEKQLFVGELAPCEERIRPVVNDVLNKPLGGLWTSTYINAATGSDWVVWSTSVYNKYEKPVNSYLLTASKDAKIIHVNSIEDFDRLLEKYPLKSGTNGIPLLPMFDSLLDYEALSKDYDAFHFTRKALTEAKMSLKHMSLGSFDCESTVWFRWCFDEVEILDKCYYK